MGKKGLTRKCFRAIEALPDTMAMFATKMGARTGWSFTFLAGGPDPGDPEGTITTMAYHYGKTPHGYTFSKANPAAVKLMLKEYSGFCHLVTRKQSRSMFQNISLTYFQCSKHGSFGP
jgi:hypothetical protein